MELRDHLSRIQSDLRAGRFSNEAAVKQGIVLPILDALGWPVFDPQVVWPEYTVAGKRVDYALCHPQRKPTVFLEVKQVGQGEGGDRQLFEYAFHEGIPLAVLTDGQEWNFYLPAGRGSYQERRVYKLDLLERAIDQSVERLIRYVGYQSVSSGEAVKSAQADYENVARVREVQACLPVAWGKLVKEQDTLLIELIAGEAESLTGYKPEPDVVASFLETRLRLVAAPGDAPIEPEATRPRTHQPLQRRGSITFILQGREFRAGSAIEVLVTVLNRLASHDPTFLPRFAALPKHGRRRRYVAQTRDELYPDRPDLAQAYSHQLESGWWVGTNYSRREIRHILEMACEVAGLRFGVDLQVDLD